MAKREVKIDEKEISNLMEHLQCSREEAISCYLFDHDMEESAEVEELTKKAKENKTTVIDNNVTKGTKRPRTYVSCDEKVALFTILKDTLTANCEKVEVTKDNKLLTVEYQGVQFKIDLIKTNTALAERKRENT